MLSVTRHYLQLRMDNGETVSATLADKSTGATIGDRVTCEVSSGACLVTNIAPRRNCLQRQYGTTVRRLAANLDHLFIVCAVHPLFNTVFIDRAIAAASQQKIDFSIVLNKTDLGLEDTEAMLSVYRHLGLKIILCNTVTAEGLLPLKETLGAPGLQLAAFTGISGVGKSSIINSLIGREISRTAGVSRRTGQGRQTTTQAFAHEYSGPSEQKILLVDLQGFSSFGLTHLSREELQDGFKEIKELKNLCPFADCSHILEQNCAIKDAVKEGKIAESRYKSYADILGEINSVKKY